MRDPARLLISPQEAPIRLCNWSNNLASAIASTPPPLTARCWCTRSSYAPKPSAIQSRLCPQVRARAVRRSREGAVLNSPQKTSSGCWCPLVSVRPQPYRPRATLLRGSERSVRPASCLTASAFRDSGLPSQGCPSGTPAFSRAPFRRRLRRSPLGVHRWRTRARPHRRCKLPSSASSSALR